MTESQYFDWLVSLVNKDHELDKYNMLLHKLFCIPFRISNQMDSGWLSSGNHLKKQCCRIHGIDISELTDSSDKTNVLEFLVRMNQHINSYTAGDENQDYSNIWFLRMMINLGLTTEDDEHYDSSSVDLVVNNFMDRKYAPDGTGNIFRTNKPIDIRTKSLWMQFNTTYSDFYFNTNIIEWRLLDD